MQSATISLKDLESAEVESTGIILSLRESQYNNCTIIIGYPGLPNVKRQLYNGDALLYQTIENGTIEVRLVAITSARFSFRLTQVSPKSGFAGAFLTDDASNAKFDASEQLLLKKSAESAKQAFRQSDLAIEKLDLLDQKVDELLAASERMGRKDWIMFVSGTITSTVMSAAFGKEEAAVVFRIINESFSWIIQHAPALLH